MQQRKLGRTGLKVSEICLGTMTFAQQCDEKTSFAIMDKAAEAGVTFIDTADVYPIPPDPNTAGDTEKVIGNWLHKQREQFVLATKCRLRVGHGPNDEGLSRKHILKAVEDSLRRLQTEYIDLYQAHAPDPDTPVEETLAAFDTLVQQGKVRYLGLSNFPAWQIARCLGLCEQYDWARLECIQPRYNILYREMETEIVPLCLDQQVGIIAYNPLAGGFLTGKYQNLNEPETRTRFNLGGPTTQTYRDRYWDEAQLKAVQNLHDYFHQREKKLTTVAIAWVLAQPGITSAIVGASRPEQLEDSLAAINMTLTDEELRVCDEAWFDIPRRREGQT